MKKIIEKNVFCNKNAAKDVKKLTFKCRRSWSSKQESSGRLMVERWKRDKKQKYKYWIFIAYLHSVRPYTFMTAIAILIRLSARQNGAEWICCLSIACAKRLYDVQLKLVPRWLLIPYYIEVIRTGRCSVGTCPLNGRRRRWIFHRSLSRSAKTRTHATRSGWAVADAQYSGRASSQFNRKRRAAAVASHCTWLASTSRY